MVQKQTLSAVIWRSRCSSKTWLPKNLFSPSCWRPWLLWRKPAALHQHTNPWIFHEWTPNNKTVNAPPTATAQFKQILQNHTKNLMYEFLKGLIISLISSCATHTRPFIPPSILGSLSIHLCFPPAACRIDPSGRGLVCGGLFINKRPLFPHAAGRVLVSTWRSHNELNNATMGSKGNRNKTNFLLCAGFPYPETAPTEGE